MYNIRAIAAENIDDYFRKKSSDNFNVIEPKNISIKDKKLLHLICYNMFRWYHQLNNICDYLIDKEIEKENIVIKYLIMVGILQIRYTRIPEYAVINETVNACNVLNKKWAKKFVNAILRKYIKNSKKIDDFVENSSVSKYSIPTWLLQKIKQNYPTEWEKILIEGNKQPPLSIRVNCSKISKNDYLKKLENEKIEYTLIPETNNGLIIKNPVSVDKIPGFFKGECSVQDGAAQIAAEIIDPKNNEVILDACSAPGSKACHILELNSNIDLTCIDISSTRNELIKENFKRLNLKAKIISSDIQDVDSWWENKQFDKILLDAPCTASGVIRRHPDIKLNRKKKDIKICSDLQYRILETVWPLLKKGGFILYATCSIFNEENKNLVEKFLENNKDSRIEQIKGKNFLQIIPGENYMDGFFYAKIKKSIS